MSRKLCENICKFFLCNLSSNLKLCFFISLVYFDNKIGGYSYPRQKKGTIRAAHLYYTIPKPIYFRDTIYRKLRLPRPWRVSMIRKYHNPTLQTNLWHHEEEPQTTNSHETSGRQLLQNNQLSLPRQDDRKAGKVTKICITKQRPTQSPPTVNIYTDIVQSTDESTLIFSYIRRFGSFFGFKILNFNIFGGFQKMNIFGA